MVDEERVVDDQPRRRVWLGNSQIDVSENLTVQAGDGEARCIGSVDSLLSLLATMKSLRQAVKVMQAAADEDAATKAELETEIAALKKSALGAESSSTYWYEQCEKATALLEEANGNAVQLHARALVEKANAKTAELNAEIDRLKTVISGLESGYFAPDDSSDRLSSLERQVIQQRNTLDRLVRAIDPTGFLLGTDGCG